jgi:hypothetical protein
MALAWPWGRPWAPAVQAGCRELLLYHDGQGHDHGVWQPDESREVGAGGCSQLVPSRQPPLLLLFCPLRLLCSSGPWDDHTQHNDDESSRGDGVTASLPELGACLDAWMLGCLWIGGQPEPSSGAVLADVSQIPGMRSCWRRQRQRQHFLGGAEGMQSPEAKTADA